MYVRYTETESKHIKTFYIYVYNSRASLRLLRPVSKLYTLVYT